MDNVYLLLFGLLFMIDPLSAQFVGRDFRTMMMLRQREMALRRAAFPFGIRGPVSTFGGPRFAFGPGGLSFDSSGLITDTSGPGIGFSDTSLLSPGSSFGSTDLAFNPFVSSPLSGMGFPGISGPVSTVGPVFSGSGIGFPSGTSGPFGPGTIVPGPGGPGTTGLFTPGGAPIDTTTSTGQGQPGTVVDASGTTTTGEEATGTPGVQPDQGIGQTTPIGFPTGPGVGPFPGSVTPFPGGMPAGSFGPGAGISVPSGPGITFPTGPAFNFPRGPGITFPSGPFPVGPGSSTMFPGGPGSSTMFPVPSTMFPGGQGTSTGFPGTPGFFPPGTVPGLVGTGGPGISTGVPGGPGIDTTIDSTTGTVIQPTGPGVTGTTTTTGGQDLGAWRAQAKLENEPGINIPPPIFRPPPTPMPTFKRRPSFVKVPLRRLKQSTSRTSGSEYPPTLPVPPVNVKPSGPLILSGQTRLQDQVQRPRSPMLRVPRPRGFVPRVSFGDNSKSRNPGDSIFPGQITFAHQIRVQVQNKQPQAPLQTNDNRPLPSVIQRRPNTISGVSNKFNNKGSRSRTQLAAKQHIRGFPSVPEVPAIPAGPQTGGATVTGTSQTGGVTSGTSSTTGGGISTGTGMPQPGMFQPGMVQPGMMQPGMMQPGMMQPGMFQPGMFQSGMTRPGMFQPGMTGPGASGPFMTGPFMTGPYTSGPGISTTGMSGMGAPGMTRPGMTPGMPGTVFTGPGMISSGMPGMGGMRPGAAGMGPSGTAVGAGMPGTNMPGTGMPTMGMPGQGFTGTSGTSMTTGTSSAGIGSTGMTGIPSTAGVGLPGGFMTRPGMPTPGMLGIPGSGMMTVPGSTTGGMGASGMGAQGMGAAGMTRPMPGMGGPGMGGPGIGASGMTGPMPGPGMTGPGMSGSTMSSTSGMQFGPGFQGQPGITGNTIFPAQTAQDSVIRQPAPGFAGTSTPPNGPATALQGGPQGLGLSGRPMFVGPSLQTFSPGAMGTGMFPSAVGNQFQTGRTGFTGQPSFVPTGPAINSGVSQPQGFNLNINTLQGQTGSQNEAMTTQSGQQGQGQTSTSITSTTTNTANTGDSSASTNQNAAITSSTSVIQDGVSSSSQSGASVPNGFTLVEVGNVLPTGPQPEATISTVESGAASTSQNTVESGASSQTFSATSEKAVVTSETGPSGASTTITEFKTVSLPDPTNPIGMPADFSFFVPSTPGDNTQGTQTIVAGSSAGTQEAGIMKFPSSPVSGEISANSGSMNSATSTPVPQPDFNMVETLKAQGEPAPINVPEPVIPAGSGLS